MATTLREVHSTSHLSWRAVAWIDGETYVSPTTDLNVIDGDTSMATVEQMKAFAKGGSARIQR